MKFARIILANLLRKKVRLLLTIGSFAVALFLFAFLAVVNDAFNRGADVAGADRLVVINRTSIINTIPLSYRDKILRIPGVKSRHPQQLVRRHLQGREKLLSRSSSSIPKISARFFPNSSFPTISGTPS